MASISDITPELCRELLRYEPDTGKMFWLPRLTARREWNTRYAGKEALTAKWAVGYLGGRILDANAIAHRVAWAIYYGKWPEGEIDHVNGDRSDNRLENLRDVSRSVNCRNTAKRADNKSGLAGVYWSARERKWKAEVGEKGSHIGLGTFGTKDAAVAARLAYNQKNGYTDRHGCASL